MKKVVCFILGVFFLSAAWAQKEAKKAAFAETQFHFTRTIELDNDSKAEDVTVEVEPGTKHIEIVVVSSVSAGKLSIEIFDPNGIKQGNFMVETQLDAKKQERVTGNLQKKLSEPQPGNWKVKIAPTAAKGSIQIHTSYRQ